MSKAFVLPNIYSPGFRIFPMILIMIGVMMTSIPAVENVKDIFYKIGEEGTRGSEVLLEFYAAKTRLLCAGACFSVNGCVGFNWMPKGTLKCELLSGLQLVALSQISDLYVPDRFRRTAIKLEFSCPTCMLPAPAVDGPWEHRCEANGVVVGIASSTSFPDLDFLLCGFMEGMHLDLITGYSCTNDARGCNTLSVVNVAFDCLWSDTQYYDPSGSLRYSCRNIITGQMIDRSRCQNATETHGFTRGISSPVKMYLCPPHMVAQRLYASSSVATYVICCLFY